MAYGGRRLESTLFTCTSPSYHDPEILFGMCTSRATEGITMNRGLQPENSCCCEQILGVLSRPQLQDRKALLSSLNAYHLHIQVWHISLASERYKHHSASSSGIAAPFSWNGVLSGHHAFTCSLKLSSTDIALAKCTTEELLY